jgi:hypothetical protein
MCSQQRIELHGSARPRLTDPTRRAAEDWHPGDPSRQSRRLGGIGTTAFKFEQKCFVNATWLIPKNIFSLTLALAGLTARGATRGDVFGITRHTLNLKARTSKFQPA